MVMVILMNKFKYVVVSVISLASPSFATDITPFEGFGSNIPLTFAVDQIVPKKYSVSYSNNVDINTPVTWSGSNDNWETVLKETLHQNNLFAEITKTDKIRISKNQKAKPTLFSGLKIANFRKLKDKFRPESYPDDLRGNGLVFADSDMSPIDEKPGIEIKESSKSDDVSPEMVGDDAILIGVDFEKLSEPSTTWPVFAGDTLESTLAKWGKSEGWSVLWESSFSYQIVANAEFTGDFISSAGKLIELISKNSKNAVQGDFYKGNKVLLIKDFAS
jgi:hypothetical protein